MNPKIYVFYFRVIEDSSTYGLSRFISMSYYNRQPLLSYKFVKGIVGISVCSFVVNIKLATYNFYSPGQPSQSKKQVFHTSMNHLFYLMDKRLSQFAFDVFCKFFLTNQEHIIPSSFLLRRFVHDQNPQNEN